MSVDPLSLLFLGAVRDSSGHADELRGFLRALDGAGHAPALRDMRWTEKTPELSPGDKAVIARAEARIPTGPTVAVHAYLPRNEQAMVEGAVNVARAMFETDSLPASWLGPLLARDEVWVPCRHNVETFTRGGIPESRLRVVGQTLDFDLFDPREAEPLDIGVSEDRFTFVTNFDFSERKGWRQLLRAWGRAFGPDDNVCLVLKTSSFYRGEEFVRGRIESFLREEFGRRELAPVHLLLTLLPAADMPRFYASADAFVLASRGEGWGRPYMEAMAMGLPTIASRFSGNLDFMNDESSWLVGGELVEVSQDADVFNDLYFGHRWFEPDVDSLVEAMREVAGDPEAARAKAAGARPELIERFGPQAMARTLTDAAQAAAERHSRTVTCAIRGNFGSTASLAVVNDGLLGSIEARGGAVTPLPLKAQALVETAPGVSHSWPPDFSASTTGPSVMILPWEFGAPPREWVERVEDEVDRVWVPSEYVRSGYVEAGMPPGVVEVVPNGIDVDVFTPDGPSRELESRPSCVFLFVGGTTWRKGADVLLEAWRLAFGPDDDVLLVIKDFGTTTHYRGQTAQDAIHALRADPAAAPIEYLGGEVPFGELPAIYRAADAVVLPYRGEGFCLPALEAMACGKPVIHNGTGPTSEFVGDDCGWALPARRAGLPEGAGLPELAADGYVHEVDPEALAERLREVAEAGAAERADKGHRAREVALGYSWERVAEIAERSLRTFDEEALPLARQVPGATVEARERFAVYAPDWTRKDLWSAVIAAWVEAFTADDPVTLVLHLPDGDAEALAGEILESLASLGRGEDALPDMALCTPSSVGLPSLVRSADAVLLDSEQAVAAPAQLVRRARRAVRAREDELRSLRDELVYTGTSALRAGTPVGGP